VARAEVNVDFDRIAVLHLVPTLAMVGVIWLVQVVLYPLLRSVGEDAFVAYEQAHCARITFVVGPLMLAELALGVLLVFVAPPEQRALAAVALGLLVVIFVVTFAVQVPCHDALCRGRDAVVIERLVASNWWRTGLWTVRGVVAVGLVWR
jgi:hypothetical protein